MRRQHPAVESAINSLEHRGLDRVRTHGTEGFARMVALSVLAGNLHRLGRLLSRTPGNDADDTPPDRPALPTLQPLNPSRGDGNSALGIDEIHCQSSPL